VSKRFHREFASWVTTNQDFHSQTSTRSGILNLPSYQVKSDETLDKGKPDWVNLHRIIWQILLHLKFSGNEQVTKRREQ